VHNPEGQRVLLCSTGDFVKWRAAPAHPDLSKTHALLAAVGVLACSCRLLVKATLHAFWAAAASRYPRPELVIWVAAAAAAAELLLEGHIHAFWAAAAASC
jgi:hypothetical protein